MTKNLSGSQLQPWQKSVVIVVASCWSTGCVAEKVNGEMLSRDRSASVLNVNPACRGLLGLPPCASDHFTVASDDIQRLVLCEIAYLFVSAVGSIDLLAGWCILLRDILESQAKSTRIWCQITRKQRKEEVLKLYSHSKSCIFLSVALMHLNINIAQDGED